MTVKPACGSKRLRAVIGGFGGTGGKMNKSFLIKMIRAKALEYEALKELMPEGMKSTLEKTEKELADVVWHCIWDTGRQERERTGSTSGTADSKTEARQEEKRTHTRKVDIM